jgi:hypothetical protein
MEFVRGVLVHLVVPLAGLLTFLWLRNKMREAQIERPPVIPLFIIFATYGGWLMIALTLLFWYWSGMALLGSMYLIFIAPLVMAALAIMMCRQRRLSRYHFGLFVASGIYPCIAVALILFEVIFGGVSV